MAAYLKAYRKQYGKEWNKTTLEKEFLDSLRRSIEYVYDKEESIMGKSYDYLITKEQAVELVFEGFFKIDGIDGDFMD